MYKYTEKSTYYFGTVKMQIIRTYFSDYTEGAWLNEYGMEICKTMELPWLNNEHDKSCISEGTYACVPHNSPAHPGTWEITNVPNRDNILLHNGNFAKQSLGCILVGNSFGIIDGKPAVLNSMATLNKLRNILPPTFQLTISSTKGDYGIGKFYK